jgi:hypothetical protein
MTERLFKLLEYYPSIPVLPSMRFKVVGFSYQTQIPQKSVPEHRTPPQIFFECAPLDTVNKLAVPKNSFSYSGAGAVLWNNLPIELRQAHWHSLSRNSFS